MSGGGGEEGRIIGDDYGIRNGKLGAEEECNGGRKVRRLAREKEEERGGGKGSGGCGVGEGSKRRERRRRKISGGCGSGRRKENSELQVD